MSGRCLAVIGDRLQSLGTDLNEWLCARKASVTVGQLVRCCGLGGATVKRANAGWRDASNDPVSSVPNGSSQLSA